jgi:6-pyruvoyltetrahydropterin/6-carboxytetrahydropterin synthase
MSVYRRSHFNAAHRLHNPNWDDKKNEEVFGLCNNIYYHGHNYELEVRLTGEVNPETGYVFDLGILASIIKTNVEDRLDHKNLNLQVPEFKNLIPSAEHIAYVIYQWLKVEIPSHLDLGVKIWETPRNCVEYFE